MKHYNGPFHMEQDTRMEAEECPVTHTWWATKRVLISKWSIYETVGKPAYQTGRYFGLTKKAAEKKLASLHTES